MCSIISTGNMHSIKEPTEFILQQTGFWENICTTTLLPLSQNISVSKCIKGQCRQSADRCSISSKWQFRHLMFKAVLSMFSTTSMPSAPTFPPASPQRSKPDRNNTNTTGTSYCHLRKRYDRTSSKRDRTMSENDLQIAALTMALTLPDTCGKVYHPQSSVSNRYTSWYDDHVLAPKSELTGDTSKRFWSAAMWSTSCVVRCCTNRTRQSLELRKTSRIFR